MNTFDIVFLAVMICGCGMAIGVQIGISLNRKDAVDAGHAKYNEITRVFEWKKIDKKEEEGMARNK